MNSFTITDLSRAFFAISKLTILSIMIIHHLMVMLKSPSTEYSTVYCAFSHSHFGSLIFFYTVLCTIHEIMYCCYTWNWASATHVSASCEYPSEAATSSFTHWIELNAREASSCRLWTFFQCTVVCTNKFDVSAACVQYVQ